MKRLIRDNYKVYRSNLLNDEQKEHRFNHNAKHGKAYYRINVNPQSQFANVCVTHAIMSKINNLETS